MGGEWFAKSYQSTFFLFSFVNSVLFLSKKINWKFLKILFSSEENKKNHRYNVSRDRVQMKFILNMKQLWKIAYKIVFCYCSFQFFCSVMSTTLPFRWMQSFVWLYKFQSFNFFFLRNEKIRKRFFLVLFLYFDSMISTIMTKQVI